MDAWPPWGSTISSLENRPEPEAEEMKYEICSGAEFYVNTAVAEAIGFRLDDTKVKEAAEVFDSISAE